MPKGSCARSPAQKINGANQSTYVHRSLNSRRRNIVFICIAIHSVAAIALVWDNNRSAPCSALIEYWFNNPDLIFQQAFLFGEIKC